MSEVFDEFREDYLTWLVDFEGAAVLTSLESAWRSALTAGNFDKVQDSFNLYAFEVSKEVGQRAASYLRDDKFKELDKKQQARFTREVLAVGVRDASTLLQSKAFDTYGELLKSEGVTSTPVVPGVDLDRLKDSVANSINYQMEENFDRAAQELAGSFSQIVRDAPLRVLTDTVEKVEDSGGPVFKFKRVVNSARACKYCREMAAVEFPVSASSERLKFHDNCDCGVRVVVERW